MSEKLKKLDEIVYKDGPIYNRFQIFLKEWIKAYGKRNLDGDNCVIKFIRHFGDLNGK